MSVSMGRPTWQPRVHGRQILWIGIQPGIDVLVLDRDDAASMASGQHLGWRVVSDCREQQQSGLVLPGPLGPQAGHQHRLGQVSAELQHQVLRFGVRASTGDVLRDALIQLDWCGRPGPRRAPALANAGGGAAGPPAPADRPVLDQGQAARWPTDDDASEGVCRSPWPEQWADAVARR